MKKLNKIMYGLRIFSFIIQFYLVFILLPSILLVGLLGYILLVIYICYNILIITELLSKKKKYKCDLIYDFMQIGFVFYLMVINYKIYSDHIYVIKNTLAYFRINYGIMSLLLIFIIIYSMLELRLRKTKKIDR